MIITRLSRKFLKITAIIFGSILVLLTAFHFWFIHHAEGLIEEMVESRSKGKLRLDVRKFKFNWFSYDMELRDAVFFSADSATASTSYRFSVKNIHIRVKEIIPLVFDKRILIDSLRLVDPDIRVSRLRASADKDSTNDESISLPQEMGRVYKSIQDALDVLKVNRFHIDNGRFTLVNKVQPNAHPVTITNIDFHLDNLQVDTSVQAGVQKILFSDNVALQTHDQNIVFPDGRHRLQFKNFSINVLNKLVVFDSCTISATKGDSSKSAFTIFFDKLMLTNIDFDTLYQKEIIKADSVYCINPRFKLDVELPTRTGPRKPPPKLDELIQQLTGDLQLAFVVVQNGSFDINTVRNGRPSSFTSTNNNFDLQGLRIRKDGPRPLTVKSFSMAIRNYENFLGDSSYAMQFDSIRLINNSILLNNFSLKQIRNGDTINSFQMPQFELRGLSWDDLVFEQKLSADRATLYRPRINYTVPNKERKTQDVFQTLAGLGDIIALNQLDISDGQINVFFNGRSSLQLQNAYVSLAANQLAGSKQFQSVQRSVRSLNFRTGILKLNDLTAKLENVIFTGEKGKLSAHSAAIFNVNRNIDIKAGGVSMNGLQVNDQESLTSIDGLEWKNADIKIRSSDDSKTLAGGFRLSNLNGSNTKLTVDGVRYKLSTVQETISLREFSSTKDDRVKVSGFHTAGRDFLFERDSLRFYAQSYSLTDNAASTITSVKFRTYNLTDSISATVPRLSFNAELNSLLDGKLIGQSITLTKPVIVVSKQHENSGVRPDFPPVSLGQFTLEQPTITIAFPGRPLSSIKWETKEGNKDYVSLSGFKIDSGRIIAQRAIFNVHDLDLQIGTRHFGTGLGSIAADVESFLYHQQNNEARWKGKIRDLHLQNILIDTLDEKNGRLDLVSARVNDVNFHDSSFANLPRLVKENLQFRLADITGNYQNDDVRYDWANVSFNKNTRVFSLDSFSFRPVPERDEFIAKQEFQNDYMIFSTGKLSAGPFDIDTYFSDTVINAGTLSVSNALLNSFRDKRKPFEGGKIKPLPVNALRKIPVNLTTDTILVRDARIVYEELNEKTGLVGTVTINDLNATVTSAKNFDIAFDDSLRIMAEAKLLDSIKIQLSMSESYEDTLAGFLLRANIGSTDARILNDVLRPLASIQLQSGFVDSISMNVVGREHLAFGEIDMHYRDLKVRFLKNGTDEKRGLFKSFVNFLANTFVIKNKSRNKTSFIFQERNREKSAINYIVKITLSGIGNGIGIKNNKKLLRQYKKELRKRNLPPVNFDMKTGD